MPNTEEIDQKITCERCKRPISTTVWQCVYCSRIYCDDCYPASGKLTLLCSHAKCLRARVNQEDSQ